MAKTMIKITNLSKSFKVGKVSTKALNNINFSVEAGEIYGVIGLSGAGKTTLLRIIATLEYPDEGFVFLNDINLNDLTARNKRQLKKEMGIVFQGYNLLKRQTVFDNIAFPLKIDKVEQGYIKSRVNELLELVGLADIAKRYPLQLSGGQRQRVAIARALATNPKVLLLDEITSALDPLTTLQILALLKEINQTYGVTIVLITHDMNVVKKICQKVAIIYEGEIVEQGKVQDVLSNPQSEIGQRFKEVGDSDVFS